MAISLVAPLLIQLIAVTILYGLAPVRAIAQHCLLLFTAFLPALAIMILLNNVAEEIGWTGFRLRTTPRSSRSAPRRPADDAVLLAVPRAKHLYRNTIMGDHGTGAGHLPAAAHGSRITTGWLHNSAGCSVLIAGLFHSMHNALVNSTGLVAVIGLPQFEVLVIMAGIVVLAGAIVVLAIRGRLGLKRPESDTDLTRDG